MKGRAARAVTGAALVLAVVTACGGGDSPPSGSTTSSTSGSASSSSSSATTSTSTSSSTSSSSTLPGIPVYYVAESRGSFKLYREFREVPAAGDAVASAVSAMTRMAPLDQDYMSPWRPATRVGVTQAGNNITIDLSADAFSNTNVGSELAATAIQQLVYTATAAAAEDGSTVTITQDGKAADVWGVLRIGTPMTRAPMADVQAQAWVTDPQQGDVREAGNMTFAGFGTSFEATFGWAIRTSAGDVVAQGSAMGGTGTGGYGSLTFNAQLDPGSYTVTLSTDDASGGSEGGGPATDNKTFTVR